jgi:TetR/AcrR family transcriptional repressor of nem operon
MYATFGSKDELYDRALERYQRIEGEAALACLGGDGPVRERLARLFARFAGESLDDPRTAGASCSTPRWSARRTTRRSPGACARHRLLRAGADRPAARSPAAGEVDRERDARALARYLVTSLNGVRVTAKATRDRALVGDAIAVALEALGRRPPESLFFAMFCTDHSTTRGAQPWISSCRTAPSSSPGPRRASASRSRGAPWPRAPASSRRHELPPGARRARG